jgi:hypothetical protein
MQDFGRFEGDKTKVTYDFRGLDLGSKDSFLRID